MDQAQIKGFTVGPWRVEPHLHQIATGEETKRLEPRTMAVLVHLAKFPAMVVSRDELLAAVWGDCFVTENTLSQTVSRLRRALGDDWQRPRFLETISKIGYRLIAPVNPLAGDIQSLPERVPSSVPNWHLGKKSVGLVAAVMAILGALAFFYWPASPSNSQPDVLMPKVTPAITLIGKQHHAVLSPDGNRIAFAWGGPNDGLLDIYVQTLGAENPLRLTTNDGNEVLPTWSPDGRHITFLAADQGTCGLFQIPVTGGGKERLADCLPNLRHMRWSPDGSLLVLDALAEDGSNQAIFTLMPTTGQVTQLTQPSPDSGGDWSPSFSPDQSMVAFIRKQTSNLYHLYLLPLEGGEPQQMTQHPVGRIRGFDWSADGKSLVFSSNRDGRYALWRHDLQSHRETRLPITDTWVSSPSLARQKEALIYKNYVDVIDMWVVDLDETGQTGEPRQVLSSTRSDTHPRISPNQNRLAFFSNRSGSFELWSGNPAGDRLIRHTALQDQVTETVAWSPSGETLVFHLRVKEQMDLFRVEADGKQRQALTETPWHEANPRFGKQADHLYFASTQTGDWQIWVMNWDDGQKRQLTTVGGFLAQEGPESAYLYFSKLNQSELFRMPLNGGEAEVVWDGLGSMDWGNWQVSKSGLYYIDRKGNRLMHLPVGTEEPRELLKGGRPFPYLGPSFHIPADESKIYFSRITQSDDEILFATWE